MSTQNLCFGAKIRKIGIHLYTPFLLYKSGLKWGINYMDIIILMKRFHVLNHAIVHFQLCVTAMHVTQSDLVCAQNVYIYCIKCIQHF